MFAIGMFRVTVRDLRGKEIPGVPSKALGTLDKAEAYIKVLRTMHFLEGPNHAGK
jgi:hypothetical protein